MIEVTESPDTIIPELGDTDQSCQRTFSNSVCNGLQAVSGIV